ncbi:MAG: quinolinate synthase NadA [Elusimicrobiota bacterium]
MSKLAKQIRKKIEEINGVLLVHNYQIPEIQDIADFTGDSLGLSREAASTQAEVIVFCGVDFMAQTAKILSPDKKVILPVQDATCPMAEMIIPEELENFKKKYPGVPVVSYVNTTARIKAKSDICCTSSNAVNVVKSLDADEVIFTPDKNLADYVDKIVDKKIIRWNGFCPVHHGITPDMVKEVKKKNPRALFMAHPECRPEVLELADYVASTGGMFDIAQKTDRQKIIVGTEEGMIYPLKNKFPEKEFIPILPRPVCKNMKKNTLRTVKESIDNLAPQITISDSVIEKASRALNRMLKIS